MSQLARRKCGARVRVRARAVGEIWRVHTFRETAPLRAPDGGALPNESACVWRGGGGSHNCRRSPDTSSPTTIKVLLDLFWRQH